MAALVALVGCRNVDLPSADALNAGDGGRGPSVSLDFAEGNAVALSAPLSFAVESVYGVASVTLSCGQVELASWLTPPYQGQVDLSPCVPFGTPTDAGPGQNILDIALVLSAKDARGAETDLTFHLTVDATLPVLTTDLPDRIRPSQPLDFTLTSSVVPGALPVVTLADLPVELTQVDGGVYHAHLAQTPAVGIDALDGGAITLEALTAIERTVTLKAEAVAPNGNHGKLTRDVLVSRILWDRPLPGPVFQPTTNPDLGPEPTAEPAAIPQGLVVPISQYVGPGGGFNVAFYSADSGTVTFNAPLLDGGWQGAMLDEDGFALAQTLANKQRIPVVTFADPLDPTHAIPVGDGGVRPFYQPATRVDHALCSLTPAPSCGTNVPLECLDHTGAVNLSGSYPITTAADPVNQSLEPIVAAHSGDVLLFSGIQLCSQGNGPTFAMGKADAGLAFSANSYVSPYDSTQFCTYSQLRPIIPTGDGDFVVFSTALCNTAGGGTTPDYPPVKLIGTNTSVQGTYSLQVGSPSYTAVGAAATWGPEHDLLLLETSPGGTQVNLYPPDAGVPTTVATVPGVYAYPSTQLNPDGGGNMTIPHDVVKDSEGLAVLTITSDSSDSLVRLGADLQPRWIYRYPRVVDSINPTLRLYASPTGEGPLYLVDAHNSRVIAIER